MAERPIFPNDALLRLLPTEVPDSFVTLDEEEQAWRGRLFLMTWVLTGNQPFSWATALNDEPGHVAESKVIVARVPDERIHAEVQGRVESERQAQRLGLGDLR